MNRRSNGEPRGQGRRGIGRRRRPAGIVVVFAAAIIAAVLLLVGHPSFLNVRSVRAQDSDGGGGGGDGDGDGDNDGEASPAPTPPNFVLIFVDDLGYGDPGFQGHPTAETPHMDRLAMEGKVLSSWYSGCNVCSGSRAALLTGRQFPRAGVDSVYEPTTNRGLPLSEITLAQHLKEEAGYTTAVVGKWHLGQRHVYLPHNRGFDYYLGIPYSEDMGEGVATTCPYNNSNISATFDDTPHFNETLADIDDDDISYDPAGYYLPLVYQHDNQTAVLEQPLDLTTLGDKYRMFVSRFLRRHADDKFFLYVPMNHVHTASENQPGMQYAGCQYKNSTKRGPFGDALAEADGLVGTIIETLRDLNLEESTLILFTSDNGPWLQQGLASGTSGLLTGQYSGYRNTGKGSNWEGGIRMPAFAYWKGTIRPYTRSSEVVSSLDVFPTLSRLAGIDGLPQDRVYDGRDMTDILLTENATSRHEFLFFYGSCHLDFRNYSAQGDRSFAVTAVRHGSYKAHFCTGPGLGGDVKNLSRWYSPYPLLFNVDYDPAEAYPLSKGYDDVPSSDADRDALDRIMQAYAFEVSTFEYGSKVPEPDGPDEGPGRYGVCCDRERECNCRDGQSTSGLGGDDGERGGDDDNGGESGADDETEAGVKEEDSTVERTNTETSSASRIGGLFSVGTRGHHDAYHRALGQEEPAPPRTPWQKILQEIYID
jgi:arylsulfatase A